MTTFKHSGTLGDLIYSLSVVKKIAEIVKDEVVFKVAIGNIDNIVREYFGHDTDPAHSGRFTEKDFELLSPLLLRQPYIQKVERWYPGDPEPDVDLDKFRGVLFKEFQGNYIEAYHRTFNLPLTPNDFTDAWLEVDAVTIKPIVVSRTFRYRTEEPEGTVVHKMLALESDLEKNGIFVGTTAEHEDYVNTTKVDVPYYPVSNFLELSSVIAGANLVFSNQTFVYSLAIGLGKGTVLETRKTMPLSFNECYFPRKNCHYF